MKTLLLKKLDAEEVRRITSEAQSIAQIQKDALADTRPASGTYDTGTPCVIPSCDGVVMKKMCYTYFGDPRHLILGPGSRDQFTMVVTFYCSVCGISYHHLPPPRT